MFELNKEIDLRGYLHEVGVLCRLVKAYRVGSQDKRCGPNMHGGQNGSAIRPR
jgi:hypothetical protein